MSDPGSLLKSQRAYKHLFDAKTAINEYLGDPKPYDIARDEESEPGKLLFWITLHEEPPPLISLAAGDAIHNLRSALDHIVYEISSKRETDPVHTGFPLFSEEADWDKRRKNGARQINSGLYRLRLLPEEAVTLIYNLQPWPRPEPWEPDMFGPNRERLRELHTLDIADKHKNLNLAVLHVDMVGIGTERDSDTRFEYIHRGPLEANTRTLLVRLAYPTKVKVEPLPILDVVFSEGLTPNEPVGRKLDELFRNASMVLNALSHFA